MNGKRAKGSGATGGAALTRRDDLGCFDFAFFSRVSRLQKQFTPSPPPFNPQFPPFPAKYLTKSYCHASLSCVCQAPLSPMSVFCLSHNSYALFCTHANLNSFIFKRFRTLCTKHPGVGERGCRGISKEEL